ncbi:MAG: diguanylate cyclase, partial [Oscillospiraceae bacterium]
MNEKTVRGIIGITDEGQPIVTADYQCPNFTEQAAWLTGIRECWYCKYADFRKSCDINLQQSICRCTGNRVNIVSGGKNEQIQQPSPLSEKFVSNIKGGVITCVFDSEKQCSKAVYINEGWTAITGYSLEDLNREKDGNPQALVYPEDKKAADIEYNRQTKIGNEYTLLYRVISKRGRVIWVIDRGIVSQLSTGEVQNQSIVTEVTEIKEQEERMLRLAQLDQLTGLFNKVTFTQQAQMVLARQYDKLHALMILDIDEFKKVNDESGHTSGDKALKALGDILRGMFRNWDVLGRIGGDEFAIFMTDIPNSACVEKKAEEICAAVRELNIDEGKCPHITVSAGIALSSGESEYEEMFKKADLALYRAKRKGKDQ